MFIVNGESGIFFEESDESTIITDFRGNIVDFNKKASEVYKISESDINRNILEKISLSYKINDNFQDIFLKLEHNEKKVEFECLSICIADGLKYNVSVTLFSAYIDKKKYLVIKLKNITENIRLKILNSELEKKIKDSDNSKEKFYSIIAHDLRNPFSSLIGFSQILIDEYSKLKEEQIKDFINLINKSSKQIYTLLENLLEWSKSQTGKIRFQPETLDLYSVINDNIALFRNATTAKNINIEIQSNTNKKVYCDYNMITTVIRNLLSNAIKFTRKNGLIQIKINFIQEKVKVSVVDSGIGVPEENIQKLFSLEDKIVTEGTESEKGSGLGLLLCKEFIEKNNGYLTVESKIGEGSDFSFYLPAIV